MVPGWLPQLQTVHILFDSQAAAENALYLAFVPASGSPFFPKPVGHCSWWDGGACWPIKACPEGRGLRTLKEEPQKWDPEALQGTVWQRMHRCLIANTTTSTVDVEMA